MIPVASLRLFSLKVCQRMSMFIGSVNNLQGRIPTIRSNLGSLESKRRTIPAPMALIIIIVIIVIIVINYIITCGL
jgi:hypothetical protein